jgi:peptidoglycan/xylan/chitin deacetylase (PgdA/CDA1 family)
MLKSLLYSRYNPLPMLLPMQSAISLTGQRLILLVYHTVCDEVPGHFKHLYKPRSLKLFTEDLHFLLRHYEPVDLPRLKEITLNREKPKKNLFFISFDDGLSEFYDQAAPVLLKKGVPATCFLNTDYIDNRDLFYRYKVSLIIEEIQKLKEKREFWEKFHAVKEKYSIPQGYYRSVLSALDHRNLPFIDEAAKLVRLDFREYLKSKKPYLSSDQIRKLIQKGFTFGGHSIDHPNFSLLEEKDRIWQAIESARHVQEQFNLNDRIFAFPFTDHGIGKAFFKSVYADGRIELSFGSAGLKKDSEYRNLQRIPMEDFDISAERRLKTDYFYYLLKGPVGKNTIHRS